MAFGIQNLATMALSVWSGGQSSQPVLVRSALSKTTQTPHNAPAPQEQESSNPYATHQAEVLHLLQQVEQGQGKQRVDLALQLAQKVGAQRYDLDNTKPELNPFALKASATDLQSLLRLMYSWEARQQTEIQKILEEFDTRHYQLEANVFKSIPVYWMNNINNTLTFGASLLFLAAALQMMPAWHGLLPNWVLQPEQTSNPFDGASIFTRFVDTMKFGLPYVAVYGGTEGFFCKNTNSKFAKIHNRILHVLSLPLASPLYGAASLVDRRLHALAPQYWDPISTLIYVGTKQGVLGVSKYLSQKLPGKSGTLAGMGLEIGMGALGNVANSIIFKDTSSLGLVQKFMAAALNPLELAKREVAPSLLINTLMAYANTKVTQYKRNDVVAATIHRLIMGVNKGAMYNSINALNNSGHFATSAVVWGAQFVIGALGIAYSQITTSDKLRDQLGALKTKLSPLGS